MVSAISGNGASSTSERGLDSLRSEDFFKIMITELQKQDPLAPSETSDVITNVSQIRSIELSDQLGTSLDQLARQQRSTGISDMLGKYVRASTLTADGKLGEVAGVVTGVRINPDGAAVLELDSGATVDASRVTHVTTADKAPQAQNPAAGTQPPAEPPKDQAAKKSILPWVDFTASLKL